MKMMMMMIIIIIMLRVKFSCSPSDLHDNGKNHNFRVMTHYNWATPVWETDCYLQLLFRHVS